jgi:hypothetical protein
MLSEEVDRLFTLNSLLGISAKQQQHTTSSDSPAPLPPSPASTPSSPRRRPPPPHSNPAHRSAQPPSPSAPPSRRTRPQSPAPCGTPATTHVVGGGEGGGGNGALGWDWGIRWLTVLGGRYLFSCIVLSELSTMHRYDFDSSGVICIVCLLLWLLAMYELHLGKQISPSHLHRTLIPRP